MFFEVIEKNHSLRSAVEKLINNIYQHEYGAVLRHFPKTLVAMRRSDGSILCAAGVRFAKDSFFSEIYLAGSMEQTLASVWKRPVNREQIAEVTCLAGYKAGLSITMVGHIIDLCRKKGITWAVFTATNRLRAMLHRSGIPALDVAQADISKVANPLDWGGYYASDPRVVAIHDSMIMIATPDKLTEEAAALA